LSRNVKTVSEIAAQSKLAKSTVHRVLKLLETSYIVTEAPVARRYYFGPRISQLTISPLRIHEYMVRCAEEEMRHLSNISEGTLTLDLVGEGFLNSSLGIRICFGF
jgi:DNA-binding IclR family transcriptional regulator